MFISSPPSSPATNELPWRSAQSVPEECNVPLPPNHTTFSSQSPSPHPKINCAQSPATLPVTSVFLRRLQHGIAVCVRFGRRKRREGRFAVAGEW